MICRGAYPGSVVQYLSGVAQDTVLDVHTSGLWEMKEKRSVTCGISLTVVGSTRAVFKLLFYRVRFSLIEYSTT
jgi:hypothetical protein